MPLKPLSRRKIVIGVIAGLALVPAVVFYQVNQHPVQSIAPDPIIPVVSVNTPPPVTYWLPTRLKIPAINVDSVVEYLGLTAAGEMATTKAPNNVAWYKLGKRPGEVGSAVIAGHYGWKNGLPAAFDHISKLQPGDKLFIDDEKGNTITFVIRQLKSYAQDEDASSIFRSNDDQAHLNLITCEGVWDNATHSYSKRLVAFADKL